MIEGVVLIVTVFLIGPALIIAVDEFLTLRAERDALAYELDRCIHHTRSVSHDYD